MNKKVLKVAFVAAIAMVSGINVFNAQQSEVLSDVALSNVEALAYHVESGDEEYECEAPFNAVCCIELGVELKGYRLDLE